MGSSLLKTIVLITGANQGLGLECVKKLGAEQAQYHIILCSRDASKGAAAARSITTLASDTVVEPLELDVTSDSSIAAAVKKVESNHGRLDVLFNNAAIAQGGAESMREEWTTIFNTNVFSVYAVAEAFVPLLKKSSFPRMVFMSSGLASLTEAVNPKSPYYNIGCQAYASSKSALNMVAAQLGAKYKDDGFKVNLVDPGFRATNINDYSQYGGKAEDGATEACRIIVQGKEGQYSTFTSNEGVVSW